MTQFFDRTILKVEITLKMEPIFDTARIHNADKSFDVVIPAKEVRKHTNGATKMFFYGRINDKTPALEEQAPWQKW